MRTSQTGASAVEYLILLGLVGLVSLSAVRAFGDTATAVADEEAQHVRNWSGGGGGGAGGATGGGTGGGNPLGGGATTMCGANGCTNGACFVAGTPVLTDHGLVPIETVAAGDLVLSRDEATSETLVEPVVRAFVRDADDLVDVAVVKEDGARSSIRATAEHRFWSAGRWVEAGDLATGAPLDDADGSPVVGASVTPVYAEASVYNVEVARTHTYFVGEFASWVHNECDKPVVVPGLIPPRSDVAVNDLPWVSLPPPTKLADSVVDDPALKAKREGALTNGRQLGIINFTGGGYEETRISEANGEPNRASNFILKASQNWPSSPGDVYRGMYDVPPSVVARMIANKYDYGLGPGGVGASTSATASTRVAEDFVNRKPTGNGNYRVMTVIHGNSQIGVYPLSSARHEQETIFPRTSRFRTVGVGRIEGDPPTIVLEIQEVTPSNYVAK